MILLVCLEERVAYLRLRLVAYHQQIKLPMTFASNIRHPFGAVSKTTHHLPKNQATSSPFTPTFAVPRKVGRFHDGVWLCLADDVEPNPETWDMHYDEALQVTVAAVGLGSLV